jgi:hypothetical protein
LGRGLISSSYKRRKTPGKWDMLTKDLGHLRSPRSPSLIHLISFTKWNTKASSTWYFGSCSIDIVNILHVWEFGTCTRIRTTRFWIMYSLFYELWTGSWTSNPRKLGSHTEHHYWYFSHPIIPIRYSSFTATTSIRSIMYTYHHQICPFYGLLKLPTDLLPCTHLNFRFLTMRVRFLTVFSHHY